MFLSKTRFAVLATVAGLALLTACQRDNLNTPTVEAALTACDASSATVELKTKNITSYAYLVTAEPYQTTPDALTVYREGVRCEVVESPSTVAVTGLEPQTDYTLYLAAITSTEEYYSQVLELTLTTTDFSEFLSVAQTYYDGFTVNVQVPAAVVEAGNVIRYGAKCLPFYNYYKLYWGAVDADDLRNDGGFGFYASKSSTVTWTDEENVVIDEYGDEVMKHMPFTPGEPVVFFAGECAWGENYNGEGYNQMLFDFDAFNEASWASWETGEEVVEDDYWTTENHGKIEFMTAAPETMDATVHVDADMRAVSGTLRLTPDEGVLQYAVLICTQDTYDMMLSEAFLDGHEEYLQWFVTSYFAYMSMGTSFYSEPVELNLTDFLYIEPETDYHVLITAVGDEDMSTQSFVHEVISTTAKTMPAPTVTVTALEGDPATGTPDPFKVWFNVKNTGDIEITQASYVANYERDFDAMLNRGYDYNLLLTYYGNDFTADEIADINSADGLDVSFDSIDGMTTRIAVRAGNEEDTFNDVQEGSSAVAENTTIEQPAAEKVESELFNTLPGDWTFTAEATYSQYNYSTWSYDYYDTTLVKKAVISAGVEYPETLSDDVYAIYADQGFDKEYVDNMFDEFKMQADAYNAKLRGQNRLLVLGFGGENSSAYYKAYEAYTPFDLFCSDSYNGYDITALFYDFGPKWYLQIAADGTVSSPFNASTMYPMSNYNGYYTYYMAAFNSEAGAGTYAGSFDVSVSEDGETLTVNPIDYEGITLYPNGVYLNYGYLYLQGYEIGSEVTLTKGYTEPATPSSVSAAGSDKAPEIKVAPFGGASVRPVALPRSRTSFIGTIPEYKQVKASVATVDSVKQRTDAYFTSIFGSKE